MPSHFSLSIPQPAAGMLGHPDAGVLARSAFLLFCICPLKTVSGKFPLLCAFRKRKVSIPVLAIKPKKLLSSLVCMAGVRTGPPAPTPRGVSSFFFFFLKQVGSILTKTKPKKSPREGKSMHQVTHTTGQSPPDSSDRTPRQRNPQLKLNPPQVEQWQKGQTGEDGCCCAEKQQSNHGGQRKVNMHRYYSDRAQQEGFKVKPDKWKCLLKCIIVRNLENYQRLLCAVAPVLHYPFLVIY